MINFRKKGNPFELLKSINRGEAYLLDAASKCHVRFRLGGLNFPPLIYYKIFSTGTVVDIGAFAPRDTIKSKKLKGNKRLISDSINQKMTIMKVGTKELKTMDGDPLTTKF